MSSDLALSQPTDVLVVPDADGGIDRLFLAAFHSDKIARLRPDPSAPGGWDILRIDIPILDPDSAQGYSVAGPRGLALGQGLQGPGGTQGSFVFVANRLDNTVAVVKVEDPVPGDDPIVGHFALRNDPTDVLTRRGREHLYDAQGHSGSGFVTCASCHVDGRTDGLAWNLGTAEIGPPIPDPAFHDGNNQTLLSMPDFPADKGPMVTQTLLGLVNYPTNVTSQYLFTNAPYHWRGDKKGFVDFNEAFVNLQGMALADPDDPKGISDEQMRQYRDFVHFLRHPPNRDQDLSRRQTGTIGDDPNDISQASETNLGMVLYHNNNSANPRACVDCHGLPDGSGNTSTLTFPVDRTVTTCQPPPCQCQVCGSGPCEPCECCEDPQRQPIETAALRNVRQREMQILRFSENPFGIVENTRTANVGLMHDGVAFNAPSLETFISGFLSAMPGDDEDERLANVVAVIKFVQQLDTGIAPAATRAHTLGQADDSQMLDLFEEQVREANMGLAVHVDSGGTVKGYWYDITTASAAKYREEGTSDLIDRASLVAMAADGDTVILQGCPLGTERRWASVDGIATSLGTSAASSITLEPMAPSTPWVDVAGLTELAWEQSLSAPREKSMMWTRQAFQQALIPTPFGVPEERHEPPRRFRVTGDDIRPGARMLLGIPTENPPVLNTVSVLVMDLFPTQHTGPGGRRIWETSQEAAELVTLLLLNGGPWAPDVAATFLRLTNSPNLEPVLWNGYGVAVENEGSPLSNNLNNFQVLKVQDGR